MKIFSAPWPTLSRRSGGIGRTLKNIASLVLAVWAVCALQTARAEIVELSDSIASQINGGFSCPLLKCGSGGTCSTTVNACSPRGSYSTTCKGDGQEYCASASYKQCTLGLSTCNAGGGGGGCGSKTKRTCPYDETTNTCPPTDTVTGTCNNDCL